MPTSEGAVTETSPHPKGFSLKESCLSIDALLPQVVHILHVDEHGAWEDEVEVLTDVTLAQDDTHAVHAATTQSYVLQF